MEISIGSLKKQQEKWVALQLAALVAVAIMYRLSLSLPYLPQSSENKPTPEIAMCGALEATTAGTIQPLKSGDWNQSATWPGGTLPTENNDVVIPSGITLTMVGECRAAGITVKGQLLAKKNQTANAGFNLRAKYIMIMGANARMEIGTESQPYISSTNASITLTGTNTSEMIPGTSVNSKGIMVMDGASLELHGKPVKSWSNLNANAAAGATTITVENIDGWQVGNEILITSSRINWNEVEKRTITAINGKVLTLNSPLSYPHIGVQKTYTRNSDGKSWNVDMRAEVGLLTRNIKIQGDETSNASGFGGHVMIMNSAVAHVNHVEFFNMGQKAKLGRYPFHWHLVEGGGSGQYLKNSSIYKSFNRAITIHGTESTLVENNFCIDHLGHGLFLEDGSERFNTIRGNVIGLSKRPASGEQLTPSDNEANEVQNRTPASFWITNPNNIFENNVAAGTQGTGFWFAMPRSPMQESASIPRFNGMQPFTQPLGRFKGNKAHSCVSGFDIFDQLTSSHSLIRNGAWQRTDQRLIEDATWYANDLAIYGGIGGGRAYTSGVVFRNNVFSDNKTAVMHANYSKVEESLIVASSGENVFNGTRQLNRGYDGAWSMIKCHLVGWQASNANYVQNTGGALKHVNYIVSGTTMDHVGPPRMSYPDYSGTPKGEIHANHIHHPRFWSHIIWDQDGSLGGKANTSIVTNHPLCRDGSEVRYENWTNLYRTDRRFALMVITYPGENNLTLTRTKAGTPKAGQYYINGFYGGSIQFPLMVNDGFLYTLQFQEVKTAKSFVLRIQDDYVAGDEILMRIKDYGKMGGIAVANASLKTSLSAVQTSTSNAYCIQNGDVYLKAVAKASSPDQSFTFSWDTSIQLPLLDTDGDGISDEQESINGTDPIPNDPIPAAQVLALPVTTTPVTVWQFNQAGNAEGWTSNSTATTSVSGGALQVAVTGTDPQVLSPTLKVPSAVYPFVVVKVKAPQNGSLQLFWAGDAGGFSGTRTLSIPVKASNNYEEYAFNVSEHVGWTGDITRLRIDTDFGTGGTASMDEIWFETENKLDCNGDWNGAAYLDRCEKCVGGNTGKLSCPLTFWSFDLDSNSMGWSTGSKLEGVALNGAHQLKVLETDPNFISERNLDIPAAEYKFVRIRTKTASSGSFQLFWARSNAPGFSGSRIKTIAIQNTNGQFVEYVIDLSQHAEWNGTINQLRIDPEIGVGNSMEIDLIEVATTNKLDCALQWEGTAKLDNCARCSGGTTGIEVNACTNCQTVFATANDGNIPENTLDKDLNTRWSAFGKGQYIQYCLGDTLTLDGINIAFLRGNQRTSTFDVLGSLDGINWFVILQNAVSSGSTLFQELFSFAAIDVWKLRIVGKGNSQNDWNSITELSWKMAQITPLSNTIRKTQFTVYPNPSSNGEFYFSKEAEYELFTSYGEKIDEGVSNKLILENDQKGLFILKIENELVKIINQ